MERLGVLLHVACAVSVLHGSDQQSPYPVYPFPSSLQQWSVEPDPNQAGSVKMVLGRVHGADAWGSFSGNEKTTGARVLDVHSNGAVSGERQAFAAGYLEGFLTRDVMWQYLNNVWSIDFNDSYPLPNAPRREAEFVSQNLAWMRSRVDEHRDSKDSGIAVYWQHVGFLLNQLDGMTAGFNAHLPHGAVALSSAQVMLITLIDGDMDDIITALAPTHRKRKRPLHCSAMVKISPDGQELWTAHTNWDDYRAMLRVIKHFDLPLPNVAANRIAFDSYPGGLSSMTDFYRTSAGLTVTETSMNVENDELWNHVTPKSMLTWARAMLANRLAGTGDDWTSINLKYQSGTCNNQWMVVDYKLFVPGQALPPGTLWVSETMPGFTERADMTGVLNGPSRAWFSYNIPYFANISREGGYAQPPSPKAAWFNCPRAKMFRREVDSPTIKDLGSFVAFMRYNNRTDPLAEGNACNGISARCDLNPLSGDSFQCFGALDIKVATSSLVAAAASKSSLVFHATMAPSWDDGDNAPFEWSRQGQGCKQYGHLGQPDRFNFTMYTYPNVVSSSEPELQMQV